MIAHSSLRGSPPLHLSPCECLDFCICVAVEMFIVCLCMTLPGLWGISWLPFIWMFRKKVIDEQMRLSRQPSRVFAKLATKTYLEGICQDWLRMQGVHTKCQLWSTWISVLFISFVCPFLYGFLWDSGVTVWLRVEYCAFSFISEFCSSLIWAHYVLWECMWLMVGKGNSVIRVSVTFNSITLDMCCF